MEQLQAFDGGTCGTSDLTDVLGAVPPAADVRVAEAKADAEELARLRTENGELRRLLARYRDETPLGHQPHMIAHQADGALGRGPNA